MYIQRKAFVLVKKLVFTVHMYLSTYIYTSIYAHVASLLSCTHTYIYMITLCNYVGAIVTEPGDVVYYPGSTIELTCELAIAATWVVNDVIYLIGQLENGSLPGHNISGINLVISNPMNNSRYYCSDGRNNGGVYRVLIAGEYV